MRSARRRTSAASRASGAWPAAGDRATSGSTHPSVFNEARRAARPVRRSAHFVSIRVADAGRGRPRAAAAPAAQQCGHRRSAWSQGSARRLWIRRISRATLGGPRDLVAHLGDAAARRRRGPTRAGLRIGRLIIAWLCHMGITALDPSISATRDPVLSPGPAPLLNMYWLGISTDSYLYNKC